MIVRRVAASFGLLALGLWGCSPSVEDRLRACPEDDLVWEQAVDEASDQGRLPELFTLCNELAGSCADRWEPSYAAGQVLYRQNPTASLEVFETMSTYWETALQRARATDDPVGISRAAIALGISARRAADLDAFDRLIQIALEAAGRADRDDLRAFAYNDLAGALRTRVRLAEAIDALEKSTFYLTRAGGRSSDVRKFDYNRGQLLEDVGQLSESRRVLERVYEASVEAGDDFRLHRVSVALGSHFLLHDELDTAREWFLKVPEGSDQAPNAALGLGRAALRAEDFDEAVRYLDIVSSGDPRKILTSWGRAFRAEADLRMGNIEACRERLTGLMDDADKGGVGDMAAMARSLYGKSLMGEPDRVDEAIGLHRDALKIVEGAAEGLDPAAGGMTFLRERAEPFADLATALALRDGNAGATEILGIVERAHARALRQILGGEGTTEIVELPALAASLRRGEVLLNYLIGKDRGVLIAVASDRTQVAAIPGWRELRPPLRRYLAALKRPLVDEEARRNPDADLARDIEVGRAVTRSLLGPVEDLLAGAERVYLIPDQDLALLPFSALPLDAPADEDGRFGFVGDTVEFAVLPMAGLIRDRGGRRTPILMAGDPLPDDDGAFPELPLASEEISQILDVWQGEPATELQREDLVAERLVQLPLGDFRLLHFATHAVASSRDPRQCAVILSGGDRLDMRRITELRLGPALVVLSACRTGEGEVIPGEGVVGLTWAFLRAGAQGVVASLWSVEDAATTELMVSFHRNLRSGMDPVRALSMAQRAQSRVRHHPVYWAPFAVVLRP